MTEDLKKLCELTESLANDECAMRENDYRLLCHRLSKACLVMMEALNTYATTESIEFAVYNYKPSLTESKIKLYVSNEYSLIAQNALTKANAIARGVK